MEEQRQRQEEEARRNQAGTPQVRERPPAVEEGIKFFILIFFKEIVHFFLIVLFSFTFHCISSK